MTVVASVDYPAKRIYLHQDTATAGEFNPIDAYTEVRALRAGGAGREYLTGILGEGNDQKTATTFTPRRALLSDGWRFVPFDGDHSLRLTGEVISKGESLANLDLFDLLPLSASTDVRLEVDVPQVEIITVATGGALLADERTALFLAQDHARAANQQTKST